MAYFHRPMKRGYVRPTVRHPKASQIASLKAAGVADEAIYVEGDGETIDDSIRALRPNDEQCVVTLGRLAPNRQLLRKYIMEILERGAVIFETKTGRRLDNPKAIFDAVLSAVDELAQDRRSHTPAKAKKYGKLGGRPAKQDRLPKKQAEKVWFDSRIKTVPEALALMDGWSQRAAYREFGPRGVTTGRPKKD